MSRTKRMIFLAAGIVIVAALLVFLFLPGPSEDPTPAGADAAEYYFRSEKLLKEHYEKHGVEMGFSSPEEYRLAACRVINDPASLHKTEKEDGDDIYYLEATNEFVVLSTDGYIRTYFCPDSGKRYFDKQ